MSRIGVSIGVVCAVLAGCGGQFEPEARAPLPPPLSEHELTWIRAYSGWAITFWDDGFQPRPGAGIRRACLEPLEEAGPAPTERLRSAEEASRRVCGHLASGGIADARRAAEAADESLLPLLLENQRLEVRSGVATTGSHIDLELGLIASILSDEKVEARCWSSAHWERFIGENNVWSGGEDYHLAIDGIADVDTGRLHLRLEHCNLLVSLRRENVLHRSREGLISASIALMTYAHEIGHFAAPDATEAAVECAAYGRARRLGPELEAERAEIELLLDVYRDEVAATLPNRYRDPACTLER